MAVLVRELLRNYHIVDTDTKLDLDIAIKDLINKGKLRSDDSDIVNLIKLQYSIPEISYKLQIPERTVYRRRVKICNSIANRLGLPYQDIKIVLVVREKLGRELSDEEVMFCQHMINSSGYRQDRRISIFNFKIVDGKVRCNGNRGYQTQGQMVM
jgi:hypothetical protein